MPRAAGADWAGAKKAGFKPAVICHINLCLTNFSAAQSSAIGYCRFRAMFRRHAWRKSCARHGRCCGALCPRRITFSTNRAVCRIAWQSLAIPRRGWAIDSLQSPALSCGAAPFLAALPLNPCCWFWPRDKCNYIPAVRGNHWPSKVRFGEVPHDGVFLFSFEFFI